jgi:hypothetical protein
MFEALTCAAVAALAVLSTIRFAVTTAGGGRSSGRNAVAVLPSMPRAVQDAGHRGVVSAMSAAATQEACTTPYRRFETTPVRCEP